jgi:hypothetical protein
LHAFGIRHLGSLPRQCIILSLAASLTGLENSDTRLIGLYNSLTGLTG